MDQRKIEHYRKFLMSYLNTLQRSAGKTTQELKEDEKRFADPIDQAGVELDRGVELLIRNRECHVIREIRETLALIDRGEFGVCRACGDPIGEARLQVRPTSRLCVRCQAGEERRQALALQRPRLVAVSC